MSASGCGDKMEEFGIEEEHESSSGSNLAHFFHTWVHGTWTKVMVRVARRDSCLSSNFPNSLESERRIRANDPVFNAQFNYADNYIKTSKYTVLTFLPLNLLEQFQRLANFYFLCLLVLQFIPLISSLTYVTTLVPLIVVLALTAMKDAIDDFQRHQSDNQVNNRSSHVLRNGKLVEERWHRVQAGDVIRMEDDQFVAADLLVISTSEPNGLCYIETAELDGETNLKSRQCLPETAELGEDLEALGSFDCEITCEPPNNNLNKFDGVLTWQGDRFPLDKDRILLRGCVLRNTKWCYGVVIFAGRDTKLMQNSGKTKFKRTSIDRLLNLLILGIVFFLFSMCLFCTIACGIFETITGRHFQIYLPWDVLIPKGPGYGATVIALLVFFLMLSFLIPLCLFLFTVEIIRLGHSFWINWDEKMYDEKCDTPAKSRTTTLNEELGQIEYVFSDKTGTLTQNIMTFNKCSIGGNSYGEVIDERTGEPLEVNDNTIPLDLSDNDMYEPEFKWYDESLVDAIKNGDPHTHMFFRLLALCHTVMPDEKDGKLVYQAQSPDESALTSAARNFGFVFKERTPSTISIDVLGQSETYELLRILDFNNVRKRMSVILKKDGQIRLFCKGADQMIYERLSSSSEDLKNRTLEHLNKFANEDVYNEWRKKYHEAALALDDREKKLDEIYEEIEKELILIGASAIEDKLQDGVPQTIANLAVAGIKIWMLTGDKQETAINIGYSCHLLTDELVDVFIIDAHEEDEVEAQMNKFRESIRNVNNQKQGPGMCSVITFSDSNDPQLSGSVSEDGEAYGGFALIVNGYSLIHALKSSLESLFLEVASECRAVICCRVTPLQKAMVVDLVKRHKKAVTLAIGDGANDVSMIKMAHIGVGISGQEGMQAVLASDFSISQFRFLERLLLVHGRWSYLRMCKFLRYFFYKNFAFTLCHFWFAFFCGFSAQTLYDPFFISCYNVFYTSLPVLALGVFDQDVSERNSLRYPKLYTPGHSNLLFNKKEFLKSVGHGILSSLILFFIPYGAFKDSITPDGYDMADHNVFGTVVSSILVTTVTAQITIDTSYWSVFNHVVVWGSVVFYFLSTFLINSDLVRGKYVGAMRMTMRSAQYWFTLFVTVSILIIPVLANRYYFVDVKPTLSDRVRLKQREFQLRSRSTEAVMRTPSLRRSRRSIRSGYAFAHQEGFGRLITSGKIMKKWKPQNTDITPDYARRSRFVTIISETS
uniref:Phospholipid-transporting ATPase n=1 Tax=Strigamia maritima TaxID=126957 RepID=T1JEU8_STRMM